MTDFDNRARDKALEILNISENGIEIGLWHEVPMNVAVEDMVVMANWARVELSRPNIMDIAQRLSGMAVANIAEPSEGDLERVLACNTKLKDDTIRLMFELDMVKGQLNAAEIEIGNLTPYDPEGQLSRLNQENEKLTAELAELRLNQPFAGSTDTLTEKYNLRRKLAAMKGELETLKRLLTPEGHKIQQVNYEQWESALAEKERLKAEIEKLYTSLDGYVKEDGSGLVQRLQAELERAVKKIIRLDGQLSVSYTATEFDALKAELSDTRELYYDVVSQRNELSIELERAKGEIDDTPITAEQIKEMQDILETPEMQIEIKELAALWRRKTGYKTENERLKLMAVSDRRLIAELRDIFMRIQSGLTTDINKVESMTKSLAGQALEEIRTRAALDEESK